MKRDSYPVEGVPSSWIKIKGVKTFCFWPKKDPTVGIGSLIRRCVSPEASWTLVECRVITKAKNYEDMVKQRKLAEEMTANESSGLEGDDNSDPLDSDDDKIPSSLRKKGNNLLLSPTFAMFLNLKIMLKP